jgi:NADH-quinone oxidoreductase subunit F
MTRASFQPVLLDGTIDLAEDPTPPTQWLGAYRAKGGYQALEKALATMKPEEVTDLVKRSGLRGRGGAGFPTGTKWGFLPKERTAPVYLCCNADESEPGTFKDRPILEQRPHLLIEGLALTCYAIGSHKAFVYVRGEYFRAIDLLRRAIAEAREAGILGERVMGREFALDIVVHSGAGAYICGEESALLNSLEGKIGWPRLRPPFPALRGLYDCPTIINNVETVACVGPIIQNGPEWFRQWGTQESPGFKIYSVSGSVKRPGNYEAPMDVTLRELIYDYAGGMREDRAIKAVIPGGSSVPILPGDQLDIPMTFEGVKAAGSLLGAAAVMVLDETVCMVWATRNMLHFYAHESCGQCTPCREGTGWLADILDRMEAGRGRREDIDLMYDITFLIEGRSICALGDAACQPIKSSIQHFRDEYEAHVEQKRCPFEKRYMEFR